MKNYPCLVTFPQECLPQTLNTYIFVRVSAEACLLCKQGEGEGDGTEDKVEVLQCTNDVDSLKENSEDNSDAAWWNKKLQRNAENELLDSLDDEDKTDIRFKLPSSSDSGTS